MKDLESIKGIGPKLIEQFQNLGIYTVEDLIKNYPYKFDILTRRSLDDEKFFSNMVTDGIIESNPVVSYFRGMNKMTFRINTQNKVITVVIFNRVFIKNNLIIGKTITVIGKYNFQKEILTANNIYFGALPNKEKIIPIYHLTKGITSKKMQSLINDAINNSILNSNVPVSLEEKYGFINYDLAIKTIHNPTSRSLLKESLKRLKYEELYEYMYKILNLKKENKKRSKTYIKKINEENINKFIDSFDFKLTNDQLKVILEIINDLKSDIRMNRLLQGDVGSGKTIVSFVAAYAVITSNHQVAFMAPTEILAKQHYDTAISVFNGFDVKVKLLVGSMSKKEKDVVYAALESGDTDIIIGTHALISEATKWKNLGLVITDEQHRFGVNQRMNLNNKGKNVDVLLMSATPIPRTYALTIYGDTDVSSIKSKPVGRKPIITKLFKTSEIKQVLIKTLEQLNKGHQVYVVSPLIEENEKLDYLSAEDLQNKFRLAFKNYNVGLLHGKLKPQEKEMVMNDFANKNIDILISTTVIEVGLDVPNTTMMIIFNADRFGLSTLHQLRGRVGRNSFDSYCYLISDKDTKRLEVMERVSDGFELSEEDFKLRGQGDLFGVRQSGDELFKLSSLSKDYDLLIKVRDDINDLM